MTYIYALVDPRTDGIRYVGKSDDPWRRLCAHHCASSQPSNRYHNRWIAKLKRLGLRARLMILDRIPDGLDWQPYERAWIAAMKSGHLTNLYPGGEGPKGQFPSVEARARMSAAGRGKKKTEAHCRAIAEGLRGKKKTAAHCAHLRVSHWSKRGGAPANKLSDEALLSRIRARALELGRRPKTTEMGSYTWITMGRRFGSWKAACDLALGGAAR